MKGWSKIRDRQDGSVSQVTLLAYHPAGKDACEEYIQHGACGRHALESSAMASEVAHMVVCYVNQFLLQTSGSRGKTESHSAAGV